MADPRYRQLAETLVHHSCQLQAGDKVLIEAYDVPHSFTNTLIRAASEAGAHPVVMLKSQPVHRQLLHCATREQMEVIRDVEAGLMEQMDAYIGIRGSENVSELSDVPGEKMRLWESTVWEEVHLKLRVGQTRWVVLRWPNAAMAQLAQQPTEVFEDFYFRVCTMDYERLSRAMQPLKQLMERTDKVRLVAPGTDLEFSIQDIPVIACDGRRNIPDGEVFTAPVRASANGTIRYNAPTIYQGVSHDNVQLEFRDGRIVHATSSQQGHLDQVLNTDEGARYLGEFAIGVNPHIKRPMKDILFDEKIAGSIHLTPGNSYDTAFNGNRSQVHWDLVLMMDPEHGGGEIWFDDQLIRRDGLFVPDVLKDLNPERLVGG